MTKRQTHTQRDGKRDRERQTEKQRDTRGRERQAGRQTERVLTALPLASGGHSVRNKDGEGYYFIYTGVYQLDQPS